jgi:hypothetical protein
VEQFERIRRDCRDEGLSIRELARRHLVHRRTVRQALADAVPPARKPPARKPPARTAPVLGPYEEIVRDWLIEDKDAPRKQLLDDGFLRHRTVPRWMAGLPGMTRATRRVTVDRFVLFT